MKKYEFDVESYHRLIVYTEIIRAGYERGICCKKELKGSVPVVHLIKDNGYDVLCLECALSRYPHIKLRLQYAGVL